MTIDVNHLGQRSQRGPQVEMVALLIVFPLIIMIGTAIQFIVINLGPFISYSPIASVRFLGSAYEDALEFSDFRPFSLFSEFNCGDCKIDATSRPDSIASTNRDSREDDGFVGFEFSYRQDPSADLWVRFYGVSSFDDKNVRDTVREFLQFLRATERFNPGFELYEGYGPDARLITSVNEASWFEANEVPNQPVSE